jgi:hypothetical protein
MFAHCQDSPRFEKRSKTIAGEMHKYIQHDYDLCRLEHILGDLQNLALVTSDGLEVRGRSLAF